MKFVFVCSSLTTVEVRQMVLEGEDRASIAAGMNELTVRRVASLARRLPPGEEVVAMGGGAKNVGVTRGLERKLGMRLVGLPEDPQIVGALGAAVLAAERSREGNRCA